MKENPTDAGVVAWFQQTATPHPRAELDEWNKKLLARGPSSPESLEKFKKYRDAVDPSRTDLTAWSDLQDLEEAREVPRRTAVSYTHLRAHETVLDLVCRLLLEKKKTRKKTKNKHRQSDKS